MAKRFVHSDQFSKVFSIYDLVKRTATLKASEKFNSDSIFYVCDASYGNWIYAQGHLYGADASISELQQIIEEDELVYAGLFNDIYDKLEDSSLIPGDHINISNRVISATYPIVSTSIDGLMSSTDKNKLDGLVNYVLPIASSTDLGGIKVGNGLSISNDGILSTSIFVPTKTSELINDSSFVHQQMLIDDELVIATAINQLHDQILDISNNRIITYTAGRDIDISNGIISVAISNASTLQEIINNYETRIAQLESTIASYEIRLQKLEIFGEIPEPTE